MIEAKGSCSVIASVVFLEFPLTVYSYPEAVAFRDSKNSIVLDFLILF